MRGMACILTPLLVLMALVAGSSLLSYGILRLTGDVLPLAKLISKATLVLLLLSIWPFKRYLRLSWTELGFAPAKVFFRQLGLGLLLGLVTLLPVLLTLYALDVQVWDDGRTWSFGKLIWKIAVALFLSLLIGLGEEVLFRGLLLSGLRQRLPLLAAVAVSSLYFALLHFLKSKTPIPYDQQTPTSGLYMAVEAFGNWLNPEILDALIALFMVGAFLAVVRVSMPNSLGMCMGCHAGWVWQIKLAKDLFNVDPQSEHFYLVSAYDGVIGPLVSLWLATAIAIWLWMRKLKSAVPTALE